MSGSTSPIDPGQRSIGALIMLLKAHQGIHFNLPLGSSYPLGHLWWSQRAPVRDASSSKAAVIGFSAAYPPPVASDCARQDAARQTTVWAQPAAH